MSLPNDNDSTAIFKILVLGESNVGKTCIVHRFCDEQFSSNYISTIGIDFKQKSIDLDGLRVKLQIWDTAGQERFRTLTTAYYRGAMGIIVMYDVTNIDSFNHLPYWFKNIDENAPNEVVKILVANKCDSTSQRVIDESEGLEFARSMNIPFIECSCKHDINVKEIFYQIAKLIKNQWEQQAFHDNYLAQQLESTINSKLMHHNEQNWYSSSLNGIQSHCGYCK